MARDDAYYVNRCLAGDRDAFGELVRRYEHAAYGLALSQVRQFTDAEDLAQEAFVAAYENLRSLQDPERFGPWLRSTVVNLCRNWRRRRQQAAHSAAEMEREMADRCGESPEQICETADLRTRVLEAIGHLPDQQRQTVALYYIDGLSTQEIGAFLGVSANAVDQRLHRAREQLKEEMIDMVEEVLKNNQPRQFPEKVLNEIAHRARAALEQQDRATAVQHFDEALEKLEALEDSGQQQRWKADMLWERGNAAHLLELDDRQKVIPFLEAALKIERELGDRKRFADRLFTLGVYYANARQHEQSLRAYEEAESIFAELGEIDKQAWTVSQIGRRLLPWFDYGEKISGANYKRALEHFRRAADLFSKGKDKLGESQAQAEAALLEELGEDLPADALNFGASALRMERTMEKLSYQSQPGFSQSCQQAPRATFDYMLKPRDWLRFPIEVGTSWTCRTFAYGIEEMWATSRITRLNTRVETPAGVFPNCLELETTLERRGEDPSESYRRLNLNNSGTRLAWFALGVGLVWLRYRHGDGTESQATLTEYSVPGPGDDYFPLEPRTTWNYQVTSTTSDYVILDHCQVTSRDGETACIAQYHYSKKK